MIPLQMLLALLGWLDREQRDVIAFLREENRALKAQLNGRRPIRAPNCNAYAERFVRSIKEECLNRVILLGECHFRRTMAEFVAHYRAA